MSPVSYLTVTAVNSLTQMFPYHNMTAGLSVGDWIICLI